MVIKNSLSYIKKRPEMFLGDKGAPELLSMIGGYLFFGENLIVDELEREFYPRFPQFFCEKYGFPVNTKGVELNLLNFPESQRLQILIETLEEYFSQ